MTARSNQVAVGMGHNLGIGELDEATSPQSVGRRLMQADVAHAGADSVGFITDGVRTATSDIHAREAPSDDSVALTSAPPFSDFLADVSGIGAISFSFCSKIRSR